MFSDRAPLYVRAGRGGDGCVAFRREKFVPKGGPDGGDGGNGGDVILVASAARRDLGAFRFRPHLHADRGAHGEGSGKTGRGGADVIGEVPIGTQVREVETGALVADLAHDGARVVVARGGAGGRGNKRYATPTRQAPRTAQVGLDGEERALELRLKLLSDAAMLGFPNAGKSSLLDRISNARPKVADYPFTTIEPQLGTVEADDGSQLTVADVPGLLEGASEGVGLGHEFLAHLERARALLHIVPVEPGDDLLADCRARYTTIHNELVQHGQGLAALPQIVVLNKLDLLPPEAGDALVAAFKQAILADGGLADLQVLRDDEGEPRVHGISCATGQGIATLRRALFEALVPIEAPLPDPVGEPELADFLVYRPHAGARAWRLLRDDGILRVAGREIELAVARHDVDTPEGAVALSAEIDRLGLSSALRRAGAKSGDEIAVGDHRFTFVPPRAPEPFDEGPDADAEW
jgi:GTP-binding protein